MLAKQVCCKVVLGESRRVITHKEVANFVCCTPRSNRHAMYIPRITVGTGLLLVIRANLHGPQASVPGACVWLLSIKKMKFE